MVMKKSNILILFFMSMYFVAHSQNDKPLVREGNKEYKNGKFDQAESSYRKAIEKNGSSVAGRYNLGNALYKQNKFDEAAGVYQNLNNEKLSSDVKAKSLYNLGNAMMKSEKYKEGANAYKEALKLSPNDKDALYNYNRQSAFTIWKSVENYLIRTNNALFNSVSLCQIKKKNNFNIQKIV